ncbi:MAG: hypothetical protein J5680_01450 [Neisseriaceae bacterium]|nr:hypothetical protein [Neisseriaceae bacterium]
MSTQSFAISSINGVHLGFLAMTQDDNQHGQVMIKAQALDNLAQRLPEFVALQQLNHLPLSWQVKNEQVLIFNDEVSLKLANGCLSYKNFSFILNDLTGAL